MTSDALLRGLARPRLLILIAVVIALTRLAGVAATPFDWDEAQFAAGVREFDAARHHPHPPGYPLFIGAAKVFHLLGAGEFRSLQLVVFVGACLLLPAAFLLARELEFDFRTAVLGAMLLSVLPNIWVYGGTGFSDIPTLTLTLGACAFLLRGRLDSRAFVVGAAMLGCAIGFRPASILVGLWPLLWAAFSQFGRGAARTAIVGVCLAGAIGLGSYAGAAIASESPSSYVAAVRGQSRWVRDVDSFRNPRRPALGAVAESYFLRSYGQAQQTMWMLGLSGIALIDGVARRKRSQLLVVALFAPIALLSWLTLDVGTHARYATSYMFVYAMLAADGIAVLTQRGRLQTGITMAAVVGVAVWGWPAVREQSQGASPAMAGLSWLRENAPANATVYVDDTFRPHAEFVFADRAVSFYSDISTLDVVDPGAWVLDAGGATTGLKDFSWARGKLSRILRERGFEASAGPLGDAIFLGKGWLLQGPETRQRRWWLAGDSTVYLPPLDSNGLLDLAIEVPEEYLPGRLSIQVAVNGQLLATAMPATAIFRGSWNVSSATSGFNELRIQIDHLNPTGVAATSPSDVPRLLLETIEWRRAPRDLADVPPR